MTLQMLLKALPTPSTTLPKSNESLTPLPSKCGVAVCRLFGSRDGPPLTGRMLPAASEVVGAPLLVTRPVSKRELPSQVPFGMLRLDLGGGVSFEGMV